MNLEDWKKANPGKTLNDYYAYARNNRIKGESGSSMSNRPTANSKTKNSITINFSLMKNIISVVILLIMLATNPTESQHYNNAVTEVSTQINEEVGNWGILEGVKNMGSNFLTKAVITVDYRRNFLLFSIQDVNVAGEKEGVSVGAFGFVYIIWN